jgi:P27 family predicted phage terminase small subunit
MTKEQPKAPADLSKEGKNLWSQVRSDYRILDATGLTFLSTACRHFDRLRAAQRILKRDGPVINDRFGILKTHPAAIVERDSSASMIRALKALNLDVTVGAPVGRPEIGKGKK